MTYTNRKPRTYAASKPLSDFPGTSTEVRFLNKLEAIRADGAPCFDHQDNRTVSQIRHDRAVTAFDKYITHGFAVPDLRSILPKIELQPTKTVLSWITDKYGLMTSQEILQIA